MNRNPINNPWEFEEDRGHYQRMPSEFKRLDVADSEDRMAFVRKVYGILSFQLLLTAMISFIPYQNVNVRVFILTEIWLLWMCVLTGLISACCLFCARSLTRQVPTNYILMALFTVCQAYTVAFSCAAVNNPMTVVMAASMTAGIVVALTLYALIAKTDFTVFGGTAFILGAAFIMFGLFSFLFGRTMELIYCLLGVCLFGFYLIIDTQLILGGKAYQLDFDDYILGAIILYLDILNIFLYLLRILTQTRESQ